MLCEMKSSLALGIYTDFINRRDRVTILRSLSNVQCALHTGNALCTDTAEFKKVQLLIPTPSYFLKYLWELQHCLASYFGCEI